MLVNKALSTTPGRFSVVLLLLSFSFASNLWAQRIVSVNQCVDQMIASLSVEQLVSVSWFSHEPHAPLYQVLRQLPANHGLIEEMLEIKPDLVIGGEHGAPGLKGMLAKFAIPWRELPLPHNIAMLNENWSRLGRWLQREQAAASIVSENRQALAKAKAQLKPLNIAAVIVNPRGWIAGTGNFQHAFMESIGLTNLAAANGVRGWAQVSLEQLLNWRPDFIIMASTGYEGHSRATAWQQHPVFNAYASHYTTYYLQSASLSCWSSGPQKAAAQIVRHITDAAPMPESASGESANAS